MDGLPTPRRYLAIVAMSFGTALAVIDGSIVGVALPTLAHDLHVTAASAVSLVTLYQLALIMTLLPFSALGVRVGLRTLYQYGQVLYVVATLLCFFAHSLPFLDFAEVHRVSALHGSNILELFHSAARAAQAARAEVPTQELTRVLGEVVTRHPPPMVRRHRIRLSYAHQGGQNPPVIVVHGNSLEHVTDAYKRFLEGRFREHFKLTGTPLRIEMKSSSNPFIGE